MNDLLFNSVFFFYFRTLAYWSLNGGARLARPTSSIATYNIEILNNKNIEYLTVCTRPPIIAGDQGRGH